MKDGSMIILNNCMTWEIPELSPTITYQKNLFGLNKNKKMEKLTAGKIDQVNADIKSSVLEVLKKHGLIMSKGVSASYTDTFGNVRFQYAIAGKKHANIEFNFKNQYMKFGLKLDDLGKIFTHKGDKYKIVGSRTKARKAPIVIERLHDKELFNAPTELVKEAL
jgi:hypothetical protein